MPELIREAENGYLVERDVDAIAARLRQLRDDPAARQRLGRAARADVVASWDWRRQAARYEPMLRAVLGGRRETRMNDGASTADQRGVTGDQNTDSGVGSMHAQLKALPHRPRSPPSPSRSSPSPCPRRPPTG
jgi:hypothetical protein